MTSNQELATILFELSVLFAIQNIPYKPRAFERAAQAVGDLQEGVDDIYERDGMKGLEAIPGVGPGIAERIEEYIKSGSVAEYTKAKKKLPVDIEEIVEIEGVGPKTLVLLYKKLGIRTRGQLEKAAKAGKLAGVKGLGKKYQDKVLRAIGYLKETGERALLADIEPVALSLCERISSWSGVRRCVPGGSVRRMQETVGDLDLVASAEDAESVLQKFATMPEVRSVYKHGEHNVLVRLKMGRDADLWVLPEEGWGATLIAWTGNKQHNIHLRTIAKRKGYMLDDFGLFRGKRMVAGKTEEEVYAKLGMQWIPPEIRTDSGEIEAASKRALPKLVGYGDLRGDLQVQTDWTDGQHSVEQMAKAAQDAGLEYIAITDHTKNLAMTGGLDAKKLRKQMAEIDRVQKKFPKLKILKGSECDILKDGTLDLPDDALAELDVVGVSVHSHFDLPEKTQTERVIRAMENPHADVLFHPTGRKINHRPPINLRIHDVLTAARRTGTVLEVDGDPGRLDLRDEYIRKAVELGVRLCIDSDAHDTGQYAYLRYGIAQARRGWAERSDIINTRPWRRMRELLK
ncbi:MAG TPA: DNA polymerase/3'-5' exonuclease PolX [Candidatus Paceibacterota bacterium]|nr:DNA polymerase/3'-5' exonuclease PolX [Candidatus Paceibacterota bacterium]